MDTLRDPMDYSTAGSPVFHYPLEFAHSCPLSQWCYPTISSSASIFSFCLQSFPASWSILVSHFSVSSGQSTGASDSASVLPMNVQGWFLLGLTSFISLESRGLSRVFSNTTVQNHQFFCTQLSLLSNSHIYTWLLERPSVQFSHFFDPMDCSTPGFPVHHQLPELSQTHVHRVSDAIQLSHPLSSPSPPALNLSQHQGLF